MLTRLGTTNDLWEARGEIALPGRAFLPVRMTVLRLPDGALLLHSPIPIDDALARELEALGPVRHLVAPNRFHHLYLRPATARWPQARLVGPAALHAKRRNLRFDAALEAGAPAEWGGAVQVQPLAGAPKYDEALLLHRPSATLVCADLVFNLRVWHGFMTGVMLTVMGTHGRLAASRLVQLLVRDRAAFWASLQPVWGWDFQRILMGHGEVYESPTAPADLRAALARRIGADPRGPASS